MSKRNQPNASQGLLALLFAGVSKSVYIIGAMIGIGIYLSSIAWRRPQRENLDHRFSRKQMPKDAPRAMRRSRR